MDLMDLNEYPNVYSKIGEATTWLPELQQPAEIIGRLDTHYPDLFEALDILLKQHAPEFDLIHLN